MTVNSLATIDRIHRPWTATHVYVALGLQDPDTFARATRERRSSDTSRVYRLTEEARHRDEDRMTGRSTQMKAKAVAAALNGDVVFIKGHSHAVGEELLNDARVMFHDITERNPVPLLRSWRDFVERKRYDKLPESFQVFQDHLAVGRY